MNTNTLNHFQVTDFVLNWAFSTPLFVSAGGGTANCLAGALSQFLNISYKDAHQMLNVVGGDDWYQDLHLTWRDIDPDTTADAHGVLTALRKHYK